MRKLLTPPDRLRLRLRLTCVALVALATVAVAGAPAVAARRAGGAQGTADRAVSLIQVDGTLDPIMADFVHDTLRHADGDVVIQVNSGRGVLSPARLARLVAEISTAPNKVGVWVGPARAGRARGQAVALFNAAPIKGVAPGAKLEGGVPAGVSRAPTLGDFIVEAMGEPSKVIRRAGHPPQRQPAVPVLFSKPPLLNRLLHAAASPTVPYFLLMAGMLLVLFEFFTVSIGLAAGAGVLALLMGSYGLGVLPTRPGAVGLLILGMVGLSIDLQAGAPRA